MAFKLNPLPILLIVASFLLAACNEMPKQMGLPPAVVEVHPVTVAPFNEKSTYLGTLKSRKSVTLSPNIDGHVTQIPVTAGQYVQAGKQIMQIDSGLQSAQTKAGEAGADSVQSDLESARDTFKSLQSTLQSKLANLEYTKSQYNRYLVLQREGAVSQSELDLRKNSLAAAQAERDTTLQQIEAQRMIVQKYERSHKQAVSNWQAQKEQLKYYDIVAPFGGIVGDIPVKLGDRVTASTALTTLTENHPLEVYISIPAEKASLMKQGMSVKLVSTDGNNYGDSKVIFISPTVDASSQTVLVKTLFANSKSELRADQTVEAQIVWRTRDGISIPTKAVSQVAGKYFVFVTQKNSDHLVAHQVEIKVLGIEGNSYQVNSGLKPDDRIITTGIQKLADGAPIMDKFDRDAKPNRTAQSTQSIH